MFCLTRASYWATLQSQSFLDFWIPFYYVQEKVSLRQLLLECPTHFSDKDGKCYFQKAKGKSLEWKNWNLYVDDDLDCFIENLDDDANSEKEFSVQTRTITRDQKTVRFLCVKEGNFILLETTSLKDLFLQLDNIGHDSKIADILHNVVKNSLPQTFHTLTDGLNEIQNLMQETEKQNNPKEMTRLLTKIAKKLRSLGEFVEDHNVEDYLL